VETQSILILEKVEVSGELYALAALLPGREPWLFAGWAPELVKMWWSRVITVTEIKIYLIGFIYIYIYKLNMLFNQHVRV
jgi:hypothetical protein